LSSYVPTQIEPSFTSKKLKFWVKTQSHAASQTHSQKNASSLIITFLNYLNQSNFTDFQISTLLPLKCVSTELVVEGQVFYHLAAISSSFFCYCSIPSATLVYDTFEYIFFTNSKNHEETGTLTPAYLQ
jgi:hypothetical protein